MAASFVALAQHKLLFVHNCALENKENGDILGKKSDCPVSYEDGGYQYIVTPSQ